VPFPFDGVGYHLYIAQDPPNPEQDVPAKYNQYMSEVRQVILDEEGGAKPIFVSEMGWPSVIGDARQVSCMQAGLRRLLDDESVALGVWFCTQDWSETWGIYRQSDLTPGSRKPSYGALHTICSDTRPVPAAVWPAERALAPEAVARGFALPAAAPELPAPAELAPKQPATAAALGIIYTTYWLRALAASSAPDPQQALLAAANDALAQIKEWMGQEEAGPGM
jgi:hypothetical protein